jgi:O-antigen/teichoic acid export membrane protein
MSAHPQRQFARSILSNWGAFAFTVIVNFVLSPFTVRKLGTTQYGAWVLLFSMVGPLSLLDLGVRSGVTRYIARFHATGEHEKSNRLYASALRIYSVTGSIAFGISIVLALLVGHFFNIPPELVSVSRVVAILGGLGVATTLVGAVYGGVLIGLERFDVANGIEIALGAARAIAVYVVLVNGLGLIWLAVVQLGATVLRGAVTAKAVQRFYPELRLLAWQWDREAAGLVLKYGLSASVLHLAGTLMIYSDSLVIGALLPVGMITYFAIPGNLSEYARTLVSGISQTVSPRMSALQASSNGTALQNTFLVGARLSTLVVVPIVAVYCTRGHSFISLWMGPQYADLGSHVLMVLSLTLLTVAGYQLMGAALLGINKHGVLIPIFIGEAIANLILSIILVRRFGVIGTAFGTAIPRLVVSGVVGPHIIRRQLGIPIAHFWNVAFIRPIMSVFPFALLNAVAERYWPAQNLAVYFGQVIATLPVAFAGAWIGCLTPDERDAIRNAAQRIVHRAGALRVRD